jgi:mitogen-activated protein kinase organizer 1
VVDLPQALPIHVYRDGLTHPVHAVAVDEASTKIASASDRTVVVHDVVTGQCLRRLQGHQGRVNAVAISKGTEIYLSASYDATVRLWDGRSRSFEPIQILKEAKDSVTALHTVQEDATALIRTASVDGGVRTYDLRQGLLQCDKVASPITGMCATRDSRGVVVNCLDGALRLLDLNTGRMVQHYADHHGAGQYALDCAVAAEDMAVVTGSEDGSAVVYDWTTGKVSQMLQGHLQPTCSVAMHPKVDLASVTITASFDGTAVVWGHDTGFMQWRD